MKFVTEFIPMTFQEALVSATNAFDAGSKIQIMKANGLEYVVISMNTKAESADQLFFAEAHGKLGITEMMFDYHGFYGFFNLMIQSGYMVTRELPRITPVLDQYGYNPQQRVL